MTAGTHPGSLQLTFRYRHPLGARRAFFEALAAGRALASACATCGKVSFPPRARCPHDGHATGDRELSGRGRVLAASAGQLRLPLTERSEATTWLLVRMDGADNAVLGRLAPGSEPAVAGDAVRLIADPGPVGHPIQRLAFAHEET